MTISQKQEGEQVALFPCPQCGSPDIRWISGGAGNHFLNCKGCLLATDDGSKERVAKRWNTRPATVPKHVADGLAAALDDIMAVYDNPANMTAMDRVNDWVGATVFARKALSKYRKATS
jgi:hypothetical protein